MNKIILSIIVATTIGLSGYYFIKSDQENTKTNQAESKEKEFSNSIVEEKKELKEDFDYRLNLAK